MGHNVPWVEKYRPIYLKDVHGNEASVRRLKILSERGNVPNMIVSGSPGTGKTVSVNAFMHRLLGERYHDAVLELVPRTCGV